MRGAASRARSLQHVAGGSNAAILAVIRQRWLHSLWSSLCLCLTRHSPVQLGVVMWLVCTAACLLARMLDGWLACFPLPLSPCTLLARFLTSPELCCVAGCLCCCSAGTVLDNQEVRDKLSSAEQTFTTDYFVSMGRHFKSSVLDQLPPAYQSLVSGESSTFGAGHYCRPCTCCISACVRQRMVCVWIWCQQQQCMELARAWTSQGHADQQGDAVCAHG
jgi:hypothetical protein